MKQIPRLVSNAVLSIAAILFAIPLVAQVPETPAGGQAGSGSGDATPDLTIADVEAALAAIEADTGIEAAVKDLLRPKYKRAIDALKEAADNTAKSVDFREAIKTAPEKAVNLRAQLKVLPSAESTAKVTPTGSTEDLQRDIASRRAAFNGLSEDLSKVTTELARVRGRPVEISARLPEVQRELSNIRRQLASSELAEDATSPNRVADRILLQAGASRLLSELEMLKQEQFSQSVREDLLQAQQELLTRQVENDTEALDSLEALLHQRLAKEATRVGLLAKTTPQDVPKSDEAAQRMVAEVQSLAREFENVVENIKQVSAARDSVSGRLKRLTDKYDSIRDQLKVAGAGGAMVQVLFDWRHWLLNAEAYAARLTDRLPTLDETRLAAFQIDVKVRSQPNVEKQFADRSSHAVQRLLVVRRKVLDKLQHRYRNLIQTRASLDGDTRQYLDKVEEVRVYIWEKLLWIRCSPPISAKTLTDLPSSLRWAFAGEHWVKSGKALRRVMSRMPIRSTVIVLVAIGLLVTRRRIGAALQRTGDKIRRISTDRYAYTGEALLWTILLAVPIPLLIGFLGWALAQSPEPSAWIRDMAYGLRIAAWVTLATGFLAAVCRPGGLGAAHFGWKRDTLARFRSAIHRFAVVYIPALVFSVSYHLYGDAADYFDSAGRIIFMLAHIWTALVFWQLFRASDGILSTLIREHPTRLITRWRYLWFSLAIVCPLALVVLAGLGYLITAVELSLGLLATVALIACGQILYGLTLRWFMIKQRKLALAEAIETRRALQETMASEAQQEPSGEEVVSIDPEDEEQLDLESIGEQTRDLLRLLFSLGVAVAIIVFWSETCPLIAVFEAITIPLAGGLTLLRLVQATLIVVFTFIAAKNLPGLLELAVLRATTIEGGTRHAITTLCQYAVIAIGLVLLFGVLHVDWAKFGWIAAALSVGLGFGLQEVVANFVCGLILLFERPIRVGDVVTVEGTTGTVTKIHMRASTITNWDRQDFVVPNKSLITGTILNWTLSAPLNRIVIPVGVAYGSDTEKARQILLDVAADHPNVLDDPAPMASFEQFADSSLNLLLRAFLPNLENRLGTITELHTEIAKRFTAAGIEIAFPQRDLHIRSGWEGARGVSSDGAGDGRKEPQPEEGHQIS